MCFSFSVGFYLLLFKNDSNVIEIYQTGTFGFFLGGYCNIIHFVSGIIYSWASQVVLVVKNPPANTGDAGDTGSIPGSERSPGEGNSNPLQYSCLGNPMDRGNWQATVHGVTKDSDTTEATKQQQILWVMSTHFDVVYLYPLPLYCVAIKCQNVKIFLSGGI